MTIKILKLSEDKYATLRQIIEMATRMGYDRDEVECILDNVETIQQPEADVEST